MEQNFAIDFPFVMSGSLSVQRQSLKQANLGGKSELGRKEAYAAWFDPLSITGAELLRKLR